MKLLLLIISSAFITACGSLPYKDFDTIQKGMDKADVTEEIGSPLHVKANKQPHVWIYRFYDEDKKEIFREIQFDQGKVIYAGPRITKDKILFPRGSSYTQKDLEEFLKDEKTATAQPEAASEPEKPFQDQATMEAETLRDLKPKDDFKEVKPSGP
jgi:hypothetical protein